MLLANLKYEPKCGESFVASDLFNPPSYSIALLPMLYALYGFANLLGGKLLEIGPQSSKHDQIRKLHTCARDSELW